MACEELFLRELRDRGFRLTPQREMVLSALHVLDGLVTADEIHRVVQRVSASVDIATVYRTLGLLQELRLVAAVDTGDGQRVYELLAGHGRHAHLVCRRCGAVLGADMAPFDVLSEAVRVQLGFRLDLENLTLTGLCPECGAASQATTAH